MILYIDTTQNNLIEIALLAGGKTIAAEKFQSERTQAEKLLPAVEKLLKAHKIKLSDLKKIEVENRGGSFTSLRIGVITANALAYALNLPVRGSKAIKSRGFSLVAPLYDRQPDITKKKIK